MDKKLTTNQYESILANLDRVLKTQLGKSTFKQRGISILFEKYLALNTDFESKEEENGQKL